MDEVPDYTNLHNWAAHPSKKDPSDSIPKPISNTPHSEQLVDVFFMHPTSYLDPSMPYGWSASLKDTKTNIYTDYSSILNQASVFNEVGKIYAPRYRQAHIQAYYPLTTADTANAIAAFESSLDDEPAETVAGRLGIATDSVYQLRARVKRRLIEEVALLKRELELA